MLIQGKKLSKIQVYECRFDGKKCESKKRHVCEKDYIWNPATCSWKYGKHLAIIVDDSVSTCDDKAIDAEPEV